VEEKNSGERGGQEEKNKELSGGKGQKEETGAHNYEGMHGGGGD